LKAVLEHVGLKAVLELDELDELSLPGGAALAVPFLGEHADLAVRTKSAYLFRLGGHSVLAVADLNNIAPEVYEEVRAAVGPVDVLFLGMECDGAPLSWSYGALLSKPLPRKMDQARRFNGSNCDSGLALLRQFEPKQAYVYAMGQEPWLTFVTSIKYTEASRPIVESNRFVEECRKLGITAERLFGLRDLLLQ
jgi:hypothetical protein